MTIEIEAGSSDVQNAMVLYQNIFETGTVTVSSQTSDGAGANALEDTTFDFWTPASVTANIDVDYGSSVECDCLGYAAHDLFTNGGTISVYSSTNDISYTLRGAQTPTDNTTGIITFPAVSARYWRVSISGAVSSIGVIKLGKRLVFPSGVLTGHVGINHSHRVELLNNTSIKGQFLGNRIKRVGAETTINLGLLDADFVETDMAEFEDHYNSGRTFFFASSPTDYANDYGYCWRPEGAGEIRPSYEEGGELMPVSIDVSAYVEQ